MDKHLNYMHMALKEAQKGLGKTFPNPSVGCVIVFQDQIIGSGYHTKAGDDHAEIMAIKDCLSKYQAIPDGSDLYVTLEPCSHQGRTPSCAKELIKHPFKNIYVAMQDPNPLVAGKGFQILKDHGFQVQNGLAQLKAKDLVLPFIIKQLFNRPCLSLKTATTMDGIIADQNRKSQWITGEAARKRTHFIRSTCDGVMVGIGTILQDNPSLTTRYEVAEKTQNLIILDPSLKIPTNARCLKNIEGSNVYIITNVDHREKSKELEKLGADIINIPYDIKIGFDLEALLSKLDSLNFNHILLEGGAGLYGHFLQQNLIDRIYHFNSATLMGLKNPHLHWTSSLLINDLDHQLKFAPVSTEILDKDILSVYHNELRQL